MGSVFLCASCVNVKVWVTMILLKLQCVSHHTGHFPHEQDLSLSDPAESTLTAQLNCLLKMHTLLCFDHWLPIEMVSLHTFYLSVASCIIVRMLDHTCDLHLVVEYTLARNQSFMYDHTCHAKETRYCIFLYITTPRRRGKSSCKNVPHHTL